MTGVGRNFTATTEFPLRQRRTIDRLRADRNSDLSRIEALERQKNTVGTERSASPGSRQYANTLGYVIPAGTLLTFYGGALALADSDSMSTRAFIAAKFVVPISDWFEGVRLDGNILLRTIGAGNIAAGAPVWLSATGGLVTGTAPSASGKCLQLIGTAVDAEGRQKLGMVLVNMNIQPKEAQKLA